VNDLRRQKLWASVLLVGLLLITAALVWHDLGVREVLGRDENATITKLDQPNLKAVLDVTYMKVTGQPGNMQPLYFLVQRLFWPIVQRSAFMLRFLPAVFGVLVVALSYKLGEALFGRVAALVGALLVALLPFHIQYAQIARPYTLLAALSLASGYWLVRAFQTGRALYWAGFVVAQALNFFTHYNALFVLAAEGLFAGIVWLLMVVEVQRQRLLPRQLVWPVVAFLATGLLCAAGLVRLLGLPWLGLDNGDASVATVTVQLTVPFFRRFLFESGLTSGWLQGLAVGFMGLGLVGSLVQRRWQAALFAALWLVTPFLILAIIKSPRPFAERYVIFVTPVLFLLAGQGMAAAGRALGALSRRGNSRSIRWATTGALAIGLALLLIPPLRSYYTSNRTEDRLDQTLTVVEQNARPGDLVVVSPRFFVRPLAVNGAEVLYLTKHLSSVDLDALTARYQRMWILYTSYLPPVELQEPLDQWVQARPDVLVRIPIKAIVALAYGTTSPADVEASLLDRVVVLQALAERSGGKSEAWQRYGVLADSYAELAELYAARGETSLAAEYLQQEEQARAAAPPPQ
jgi:4-amino-4-deoxy-L-arabinose transferase-like glycosyltransferase